MNLELKLGLSENEINEVRRLLVQGDEDFISPLSKRTGTTMSDFSKTVGGIDLYLSALLKQYFVIASEDDKTLGFLSFIVDRNYKGLVCDYISTVLVDKEIRNRYIAKRLYAYLFTVLRHTFLVRTWSTNSAHLHILNLFGFKEY